MGKIPFGIMNEPESVICHFKEKVSNPEIEVTVNVSPFVSHGQVFENNSVRHVGQHITNAPVVPEEMAVVHIIPVMIVYKERWLVHKPANNVSPSRVLEIMPVEPVRVRMVGVVIIYPTVKIPAVSLPASVPVIVFSVIVIPVEAFIPFPVICPVGSSSGIPVFFASTVFFAGSVPSVIFVQAVNIPFVVGT